MLTLTQVQKLYNKIQNGEATVEDVEQHNQFGPLLTEWRASLDAQGSNDFSALGTLLLQGRFEAPAMLSLMKAEQGAREHFGKLIAEIRELATENNFPHDKLVYNKSSVRKLIDAYDVVHQVEDAAPVIPTDVDDLEALMAAAKALTGGNQRKYAKVRYWLGMNRPDQDGTGPLTNGHTAEPELPKADKLADLL